MSQPTSTIATTSSAATAPPATLAPSGQTHTRPTGQPTRTARVPQFQYAERFTQDLLRIYGAYYASLAHEGLLNAHPAGPAGSGTARLSTAPSSSAPTSSAAYKKTRITEAPLNNGPCPRHSLAAPRPSCDPKQTFGALERFYGTSGVASLSGNASGTLKPAVRGPGSAASGSGIPQSTGAVSTLATTSAAVRPAPIIPMSIGNANIRDKKPTTVTTNSSVPTVNRNATAPPTASQTQPSPTPSSVGTSNDSDDMRESSRDFSSERDFPSIFGTSIDGALDDADYMELVPCYEENCTGHGPIVSDATTGAIAYQGISPPLYLNINARQQWAKARILSKDLQSFKLLPLYEGDMYGSLFEDKQSPYKTLASFRPMVPEAKRSPFNLSSFPSLRRWLPAHIPSQASASASREISNTASGASNNVANGPEPAASYFSAPQTSTTGMSGQTRAPSTANSASLPIQRREIVGTRDTQGSSSTASSSRRHVGARRRTRADDRAPSRAPNSDPPDETLSAILRKGATCRAEMMEIKEHGELLRKRMCDLELEELELEEKLIKDGTHPEYVTKIADITNAREARLSIAANRLRHSMIHIDSELNAAIEQASDTFLDRRWNARRKLLNSIGAKQQRLVAERNRSLNRHPAPTLSQSPVTIWRKKVARAPQSLEEAPDWVKKKLSRKRDDVISGKITIPCFPQGLTENEKEEDLLFIRMLTAGLPGPQVESDTNRQSDMMDIDSVDEEVDAERQPMGSCEDGAHGGSAPEG